MKRLLALLAGMLLLASACSSNTTIDAGAVDDVISSGGSAAQDPSQTDQSDSDDQAGQTTESAPTTAPIAQDDTADEPSGVAADEPAADEPAADEPAAVDGYDTSNDAELASLLATNDWCTIAAGVEDQFDEQELVDFASPVSLEETFKRSAVLLAHAQRIAPPEIAADVAVTAQGIGALVQALEEADWSFLDLDLAVLEQLEDASLEQAAFNIQKYNFEVCGIDEGFDPADDPSLNPDSADDDVELPQGSVRDQVLPELTALGFTVEEASCLLDNLDLTNADFLAEDPAALFSVFTDCGIALDRLAQLGQ